MTIDERQNFLQSELAAMDVRTASIPFVEDLDPLTGTEERPEDFGSRNEW
jgi:hypothetical protein